MASTPETDSTVRTRGRSVLALILFLVISFAVAAFGGLSTAGNVDGWYAEAAQPAWTPPNVVFGPVWTVLYTLMSVAAWLVWRTPDSAARGRALRLYVAQLAVNAIWTPVFFGLEPFLGAPALWIALVIIVVLDVLVIATIVRFAPLSRLAAAALVPYALWALYATTLNAGLAVLNS
ncbi:TspO/MBR family protein [uncultured Schumannella sp.]|uniref:TspO/MBR family protein n=1 Tax=uncultured Schumannella sp. TaxID=1195956 RepID=UPI0025F0F4A8|nr:TspO/MBR family protein [uncultured Schumannella sp.]